jgi:hypothetical protein
MLRQCENDVREAALNDIPSTLLTKKRKVSKCVVIPEWMSTTKQPTEYFSCRQIVWLSIQGIASTGICWGVNYGLGLIVYTSDNPPPTLWNFPVPIAGHLGMLCIIEVLINWILVGTLQTYDVLTGIVEPMHPKVLLKLWPTKDHKLEWWLRTSDIALIPENSDERYWGMRIKSSLLRSFPWMLYSFCLTWPLFSGISFAIWGDTGYNTFPLPQYITATCGAAISLVTVPIWGLITLVSLGSRIIQSEELMMIQADDLLHRAHEVTLAISVQSNTDTHNH